MDGGMCIWDVKVTQMHIAQIKEATLMWADVFQHLMGAFFEYLTLFFFSDSGVCNEESEDSLS